MKFSPSSLLDILYPRRCALCDCVLAPHEPYLCRDCSARLRFRTDKVCIKCGRPRVKEELICNECAERRYRFDECIIPFSYSGIVKESILKFKYHGRPEYARFFAAAILYFGGEKIRKWKPDAIVPVPVHKKRLAVRGYNQAELLAAELSARTGIPLADDLIARTRKTEAQKELGYEDRRENLKNAFVYTGSRRPPKTLLVVDDIFTTGSTMDLIAAVLKEQGAGQVFGICISS